MNTQILVLLLNFVIIPSHGEKLSKIYRTWNGFNDSNMETFESGEKFIPLMQDLPQVMPAASLPKLIKPIDRFLTDEMINLIYYGLSNPDLSLNTVDIIMRHNYPLEEYEVDTEDRYSLTVFRIPNSGPPVLLMHGLLGSSDDFVLTGPKFGLAFLLAKEGYDVWLGNARGNKYSRLSKTPHDNFWAFSFHEIGCYDLPAIIDHVLKITEKDVIKYIGHSQGTSAFFAMMSERVEYNRKISFMAALSPMAFMRHVKSPMIRLLAAGGSVGDKEFAPDKALMRILKKTMCGEGPLSDIICENPMFLTSGFNLKQYNLTTLSNVLAHVPAGGSAHQFLHYGQLVHTENFRMFDHGLINNLRIYGIPTPLKYSLNHITVPISLFYSSSDLLASPRDVKTLQRHLRSVVSAHLIKSEGFSSLDFLFSKNVKYLVYNTLFKLLMRYY